MAVFAGPYVRNGRYDSRCLHGETLFTRRSEIAGDAMTWRRVSVLVTGGAGCIGGRLCERLVSLGADVTTIDNLDSGYTWRLPPAIKSFVQGNILDEKALSHAFDYQPRVVFHLAALFANQNSLDHPEQDLAVNGLGTLRVLERSIRCKAARLVYASSSCVYGNAIAEPNGLNGPVACARTPYQATKLLGEQYAQIFRDRLSIVTVRIFNCYGPGDVPGKYRSVVPNFVAAALRDKPINVHGEGTDTRDYTYVDDVVEGLLQSALATRASGRTYDIGSGVETSVLSLATMIRSLCASKSPIFNVPKREWDVVRRRRADTETAGEDLGWKAKVDLSLGLAATIKWHRSYGEKTEASSTPARSSSFVGGNDTPRRPDTPSSGLGSED
jgi:UDP-glucose 4-epimerase